jgi:tRNA wybutosine-synthesizing protein 4
MGTFWNSGVYSFHLPAAGATTTATSLSASRWSHKKTIDIVPGQSNSSAATKAQPSDGPARVTPIPRLKLETANDFLNIVRKGGPVVLEGLDLGSCVSAWTLDYLVDKVGKDRRVRVPHSANIFVSPPCLLT